MFACKDFNNYVPDIITTAKGMSSGYSPIGAMIASDRLFEPFNDGTTAFAHGCTFGGHPVSAAVALANLNIFEREGLSEHVKDHRTGVPGPLERLLDLPIVGDVRGEGLLLWHRAGQGQGDREILDDELSGGCCAAFLSVELFEAGSAAVPTTAATR